MPSAEITNALTNLLHAVFLFAYFMLALQHRIKDKTQSNTPQLFSTTIVLFFFTIVIMKLMAVYIHYAPEKNLALFLILLNGYFAIKTTRILRYGFLMLIFANVTWYSLRLWISHLLKLPDVPYAFRYDNDIYHLLLILGTFMIYKGFPQGLWKYSVIDAR